MTEIKPERKMFWANINRVCPEAENKDPHLVL